MCVVFRQGASGGPSTAQLLSPGGGRQALPISTSEIHFDSCASGMARGWSVPYGLPRCTIGVLPFIVTPSNM